MSVTYIPAPTPGKDFLESATKFNQVMMAMKTAAIEQQLAQSQLQNAFLDRQAKEVHLQTEQQQANEFLGPDAIQQRTKMRANEATQSDLTTQGMALDLAGKGLRNTGQQFENTTLNPLRAGLLGAEQKNYEIQYETAKKKFENLGSLLSDESEIRKNAIAAGKAEALTAGINARALALVPDDLLAKGKLQQLEQGKQQLLMTQQQIELQKKGLDTYDETKKLNKIREIFDIAKTANTPGALRAIAKEFPDMKFLEDLPDEAGQRSMTPQNMIMNQAMKMAKEGDESAISFITTSLNKALGMKPETPEDAMKKTYYEKAGIKVSDEGKKVTENFIRSFIKNAKPNAAGDFFTPEGQPISYGDTSQTAAPVKAQMAAQPVMKTGQQSINFQQGDIPPQTPSQPQPTQGNPVTPATASGTTSLQITPESLKDSMKVLKEVDERVAKEKDVAAKTYLSNKEDEAVTNLVLAPYDKSYTLSREKIVYNHEAYDTKLANNYVKGMGGGGGGNNSPQSVVPQDFQERLQSLDSDPSANSGQEARYRVALGQLARGYKEGGSEGLQKTYDQLKQHFQGRVGRGPAASLTIEQAAKLKSLIGDYGLQQ